MGGDGGGHDHDGDHVDVACVVQEGQGDVKGVLAEEEEGHGRLAPEEEVDQEDLDDHARAPAVVVDGLAYFSISIILV
ncbi:hypothetical protein Pyn_22019 [Prunus yedoensis var. nudiflora]|uniref:Uncharacterized protein n=1 Tax=Prunus yedoensis var. nudiflora TaxID=2094558 RepID=A0A314UBI5_PRUYE|nr:hypothetical protein Pyn_08444 [Prunus yedoensis var. nudiflora]PQP98308.1 hypothetical protein Pyn_22019 [Prunus yedoensis var. nudiflora]